MALSLPLSAVGEAVRTILVHFSGDSVFIRLGGSLWFYRDVLEREMFGDVDSESAFPSFGRIEHQNRSQALSSSNMGER